MELQADCLAGVWANLNNQLKNRLQPGDIEEGLNAASQIGDDMIQRQTQGQVVPESFTHGSSAQRVRWFKTGFEGGNMQVCDTFPGAPALSLRNLRSERPAMNVSGAARIGVAALFIGADSRAVSHVTIMLHCVVIIVQCGRPYSIC